MTIDITGVSWQLGKDGCAVILRTRNQKKAMELCDSIEDGKHYEAEIRQKRKKRSLDANAYAWVLLGKLSEKIGLPPEEIYRQIIIDIGGNYEIVPIKVEAVERWVETWRRNGIGWICESLGESKIEGYENIICYYRSSVYDTAQMSRLIKLIVEECKTQGIEIMTPEELNNLFKEEHNAQSNSHHGALDGNTGA